MARKPIIESALLDAAWSTGDWLTVAEFRARLDRPLSQNTVGTVLGRLWKKGLLERRKAGRRLEFRPALSREDYVTRRIGEVLEESEDRAGALMMFLATLDDSEKDRVRSSVAEL